MGHLTGVLGGNGAVEGGVKCVSVKVVSNDISCPSDPILSLQNYWAL